MTSVALVLIVGIYSNYQTRKEARRAKESLDVMEYLLKSPRNHELGKEVKYIEVLRGFAQEVVNTDLDQDMKALMHFKLGYILLKVQAYDEALVQLESAREIWEKIGYDEKGRKAALFMDLGEVHESKRNYKTALDFYEKGYEEALSTSHPATLQLHVRLALLNYRSGNLKKAREVYEESFLEAKKANDIDALLVVFLYISEIGNMSEVDEVHSYILSVIKAGEFSPDRYFNLQREYLKFSLRVGRFSDALNLSNELILYAGEHGLEKTGSYNDVMLYKMNSLLGLERVNEAIDLIETCLSGDLDLSSYIKDQMLNSLAGCYYELGEFKSSLDIIEKIYNNALKRTGINNTDTLIKYMNFALLKAEVGELEEANEHFEKMLPYLAKNFGAKSHEFFQGQYLSGLALQMSSDDELALPLLISSLTGFSELYPENHLKVLMVERVLALSLLNTSRYTEAREVLDKTVLKHFEKYGEKHRFTKEVVALQKKLKERGG